MRHIASNLDLASRVSCLSASFLDKINELFGLVRGVLHRSLVPLGVPNEEPAVMEWLRRGRGALGDV